MRKASFSSQNCIEVYMATYDTCGAGQFLKLPYGTQRAPDYLCLVWSPSTVPKEPTL